MKYKHLISLSIIAALISACSTSPTGRSQLTLMSEAELAQEGSRQLAIIRAQAPLVEDGPTIDYIACVANAIIEVLPEEYRAMYWEMAIVNQPVVNASAMAGGKIIAYKGILTVATNQNQLAAVMGHEVAHVTAKHVNERMSRAMATGVFVDIGTILAGGGYYNRTRAASETFNTGATLGIMYPHTRLQESEADVIGLEYMAKAGFDPRESVELWQNMGASNKQKVPEMLSTHPSDETRMEQLISELPQALAWYNEAQLEGRDPNCDQ